MRNHRCLRIVQYDTFLAVNPARFATYMGEDSVETKDGDLVHKCHLLRIEDLALPGEEIDELGNLGRESGAGCDDRGAVCVTVGYGSSFGVSEEDSKFRFGFGE